METVTIRFELLEDQALALAQFVKRVGYDAYRQCAIDEREAYEMLFACDKLRRALAEAGFAVAAKAKMLLASCAHVG